MVTQSLPEKGGRESPLLSTETPHSVSAASLLLLAPVPFDALVLLLLPIFQAGENEKREKSEHSLSQTFLKIYIKKITQTNKQKTCLLRNKA